MGENETTEERRASTDIAKRSDSVGGLGVTAENSPIEWKLKQADLDFARGNLKHGLCASIPITCRGADDCPYKDNCAFVLTDGYQPPVGSKCPLEIAMVDALAAEYKKDIAPKTTSITIMSLIRDLIDVDITIERTRKLTSSKGDVVEEVYVNIDEDGKPVYKPEITKEIELWDKLIDKRAKILKTLNATPEAKAKTGAVADSDPSTLANEIIAKVKKAGLKLDAEG